jgi:alpha-1,6-mannosyltransferase
MRTSTRARWALAVLVAGYLAIAVVAGVPRSPLTVPLPAGARPPAWAADLATAARLDRVSRDGLIAIAWVLVVTALLAFAVVVTEAWARRMRLPAVLIAAGVSLAIAIAAPLLLSRDVYTYAAYGRIEALGHRNPYLVPLSSFPHDPFVALTPGQWVHGHSHYGPLFTLMSAAIARIWPASPGATILAFKLLAGLAIAAATLLAALAAGSRAPLAAALVGLNPVIVIHTVGGGHVDAVLAALLAAAAAIALTRKRALAVTLLLAAACLVKTVMLPVLALWLFHLARTRRERAVAQHLAVVAAAAVAAAAPYAAGWRTLRPFATLGGVEAWASPSHLVGQAVGGGGAATAVEALFLLAFLALVWRLANRRDLSGPGAWGIALLLLALSLPYVLPWYAAWFAPLLALLADDVLLVAGVVTTAVLALTLIPADPFHGLTTPAVMDGVHYGAASVLLVVFLLVVARVLAPTVPATGLTAQAAE